MRVQTAQGHDRGRMALFAGWLLTLGNGLLPSRAADDTIELPANNCLSGGQEALIDWTFDGLHAHIGDAKWLGARAILAPRHSAVNEVNQTVLDSVNREEWVGLSADSLAIDETTPIPIEYLNAQADGGMPPHELRLKHGVPVMLLRNLDLRAGLCNGTRLLVDDIIENRLLRATIITGSKAGNQVLIPRIRFYPEESTYPFHWHRTQVCCETIIPTHPFCEVCLICFFMCAVPNSIGICHDHQ
jgi:ATP-dependent DNA helicase PIF1